MAIAARANAPLSVVPAIRAAVQKLDQDLPVFELRTMAEVADRQIWFLRVFGTVFLVFATVALVIASVGIYAVMAQATGSRTQEIGVRMALGATPEKIAVLIFGAAWPNSSPASVSALSLAFPWPGLSANFPSSRRRGSGDHGLSSSRAVARRPLRVLAPGPSRRRSEPSHRNSE